MFWVLGTEYEWGESYAELLMEKKNCGKCEVIFEDDVLYSIPCNQVHTFGPI